MVVFFVWNLESFFSECHWSFFLLPSSSGLDLVLLGSLCTFATVFFSNSFDFICVFSSFTEMSFVLLGFTGFYWFLMGFIGFY